MQIGMCFLFLENSLTAIKEKWYWSFCGSSGFCYLCPLDLSQMDVYKKSDTEALVDEALTMEETIKFKV